MAAFFQELFHASLYKRTQGRITRQVTFATMAVVLVMGCWRLGQVLMDVGLMVSYAVPSAVFVAGLWMLYRLVNLPAFADFLIAVEAEMNKVSWPTRTELIRSSVVVLVTIFALAVVLFAFDLTWKWLFANLGILPR